MKKGGETGAFVKVILPDGREGYVEKKSVRDFEAWKKNAKPSADVILATASGLMGVPYLWGGSSVKGVDCSGFVQNAFFQNGIILSRDASLQALHGELIDIEQGYKNLIPGDLLFFGSIRNSKPRVTHVAIYKGDSEFIHSATRVNVNSLDSTRNNYSQYRRNSFLLARRIIGNEGSDGITFVRDHPWY
jgi:cell wall-associated NlpC family hydrolase